MFYGSKGYLAIDGYGQYKTWLGKEQEPGPSRNEDGNNWANFIDAVRSRKQSDLNAPIEEGYMSTVLVHLANISYRLGRTLEFDAENLSCKGDPEATAHVHAPVSRAVCRAREGVAGCEKASLWAAIRWPISARNWKRGGKPARISACACWNRRARPNRGSTAAR